VGEGIKLVGKEKFLSKSNQDSAIEFFERAEIK
jgi:hypothetical protein